MGCLLSVAMDAATIYDDSESKQKIKILKHSVQQTIRSWSHRVICSQQKTSKFDSEKQKITFPKGHPSLTTLSLGSNRCAHLQTISPSPPTKPSNSPTGFSLFTNKYTFILNDFLKTNFDFWSRSVIKQTQCSALMPRWQQVSQTQNNPIDFSWWRIIVCSLFAVTTSLVFVTGGKMAASTLKKHIKVDVVIN